MKPVVAISSASGEDKNKFYIESIREHGGEVLILSPTQALKDFSFHALLLTGGGDLSEPYYDHPLTPSERRTLGKIEPEREEYEKRLMNWAKQNDLPTLGICRGCQMMNIFAGGTILPDIPIWQTLHQIHPKLSHRDDRDPAVPVHDITIDGSSQFYRILDKKDLIGVNSSHHQALSHCAESLNIVAESEDGMIEAVEDPKQSFWIGVQFHPERMWRRFPIFSNLFLYFMERAQQKVR